MSPNLKSNIKNPYSTISGNMKLNIEPFFRLSFFLNLASQMGGLMIAKPYL